MASIEGLGKLVGRMNGNDVATHIGDEVFWSVEGVYADRSNVEAMLTERGIDSSVLASVASPEKTLRRAIDRVNVSEAASARAKCGKDVAVAKMSFLRFVAEDREHVVFAVVEQSVVEAERIMATGKAGKSIDLEVQDRVWYDKVAERLGSDKWGPVATAVRDKYEYLSGVFTSQDLLDTLRRAMDYYHAIPIRDHGGVYFVSSAYTEQVAGLADVVSRLGVSQMGVLNLFGTRQSREAIGRAAQRSIETEVVELRGKLEAFSSLPGKSHIDEAGGKHRISKVAERRIEDLDALRAKVGLYRDVLGAASDSLLGSLRDAEAAFMQSIGL